MSEDKQIGITSQGYEIWDNGKGFQWAICRRHDWAYVESYGSSGFNVDEACIGCLVEERIIKLLEGFDDSCLWRQVGWSPDAYEGFNMQDLISLIKGEQDEDACEPSDSPCVNGWSCQKHRMTIEQLIDFLAEINGENK